jgi:DNA-binding NarL/FixJ family response regulator
MTEAIPAGPAPLRVLVVDPDDCIRESLARLMAIGGQCTVVGSACQQDMALELTYAIRPDVVMVDSRLVLSGAERDFIDRLRAIARGVRIVVLSLSETSETEAALIGADAYIKKTFRPHELIDAVINAARSSAA